MKRWLKGGNVILAAELTTNSELFEELNRVTGLEVYAIGGSVDPRTIFGTIHKGYQAAFLI